MNIYVGNLSRQTTEEDLRKAFEAFGQVESANVIQDKFTGERGVSALWKCQQSRKHKRLSKN
jgi:RNA recognition motif-containing protein